MEDPTRGLRLAAWNQLTLLADFLPPSPSLSLCLCVSVSVSPSLSLCLCLSVSLSLSLCLSVSFTHSLTHSLTLYSSPFIYLSDYVPVFVFVCACICRRMDRGKSFNISKPNGARNSKYSNSRPSRSFFTAGCSWSISSMSITG